MRLILIGPPGAGKGTVAPYIKEAFGIPHIATGDIFRQNLRDNTPLGQQAKVYMNQGKLVPDDLTIELVKDRLRQDDCKGGFLLDGFPRNLEQARALRAFLQEQEQPLDAVIDIEVDRDILKDRIMGRRMCKDCKASFHIHNHPPKVEGVCDMCGGELYQREDDREETVQKRIGVYEQETSPLIDFYRQEGVLRVVNGDATFEEVRENILKTLREIE